jgi:hypothetical protein
VLTLVGDWSVRTEAEEELEALAPEGL